MATSSSPPTAGGGTPPPGTAGRAPAADDAANRESEADRARRTIPRTLLIFLIAGLAALGMLWATFHITLWAAVMWSLAIYAAGVLGGFVFGIPRVVDREPESVAQPPNAASGSAPAGGGTERVRAVESNGEARRRRRSSTNSNLVEVSDWLTKIIVGVGLVELKKLPDHGQSLAEFIARSVVPVDPKAVPVLFDAAVSISGAIALYFGVLGFITGYLLTRIFLAVVMSLADRDVDAVQSSVEMPGGQLLPLPDLLENFRTAITDVQSKLAGLFVATPPPAAAPPVSPAGPFAGAPLATTPAPTPTPAPAQAPAAPVIVPAAAAPAGVDIPAMATGFAVPATPTLAVPQPSAIAPPAAMAAPPRGFRPRRVLWVDDAPNRNALLAARLREAAVAVDQVTTTREAIQHLTQGDYALVITDIVRRTEQESESAGLRLLREVRARFPMLSPDEEHLPVLVFCGRTSEARARRQALEGGADLVTSSSVDLIAFLTNVFGPV